MSKRIIIEVTEAQGKEIARVLLKEIMVAPRSRRRHERMWRTALESVQKSLGKR